MDVEEHKTENEDKSNKAFDLLDYIGEIGVYQVNLPISLNNYNHINNAIMGLQKKTEIVILKL